VGENKLDMAKIQLLQLPQNAQNLRQGQNKVPKVTTVYVLWQLGWICLMATGVDLFAVQETNSALLISAVWKGTWYVKSGSGFSNYYTVPI
jgi:hypothetical protein